MWETNWRESGKVKEMVDGVKEVDSGGYGNPRWRGLAP